MSIFLVRSVTVMNAGVVLWNVM